MRLFHISEESNIEIFNPRLPNRTDLDPSIGLVWAINEQCLPNFLTPRNCPRVTYHIGENTSVHDIEKYMSSTTTKHVVVIEHPWFEKMQTTHLYMYEFDISNFQLQDPIAGYYVSTVPQVPIAKYELRNLFKELFDRNVELRVVDDLWNICEAIKQTSFDWSMCRMSFARSRS